MQEVDLDHEGVKKVLLVEITRNIKNAQLTKWESTTDVKKYDINRRIYLPKWVEEDLGIIPGQSYVTFVQDGKNIVIKKVSISIA